MDINIIKKVTTESLQKTLKELNLEFEQVFTLQNDRYQKEISKLISLAK